MRLSRSALAPGLTALLLAAAAVTSGCSTVPKAPPRSPSAGAPAAAAPPSPWLMPAGAYGSQILYRVAVAGAEGEGSLRLTLRLASPERFQAEAVDPLGRALWGLDVDGEHGLWLDHRAHTYCRLSGAPDLAFLPIGPLPLSALPPLLLGRLPVPPADPAGVVRGAAGAPAAGAATSTVAYRDTAGRGWSAVTQDGQLVSWGLWQEPATAPLLSWATSGSWSVLSDRRKGVQVRWREALREPLGPLAPMRPRPDDKQGGCAAAAAPPPAVPR